MLIYFYIGNRRHQLFSVPNSKMFWGLTIEPGKHYSQTVDQSFHVSMAALDTREKSGITQLLVRHEKAEFLLCTLQYGDGIPYPCLQQSLNLNLSEGSEISFYSEGKGTIHLTGYLVTDEPIMEDPDLVAEANSLMCSDEEEDFDSDEDDDDEEEDDDEEYSDSDMESDVSQDASWNWQKLIDEFDDGGEDEDSNEEEWTPESAKKSAKKEKKRKSQDDSMSDELSLSAYKKKRKAALQAETISKMEIAADGGADDDDEDDDEEEDDDFNPVDELEDEDDDDEEEEEDDEGDDDEEEEEEKPKSSPKKKDQTPKGRNVKSPSTSPQKGNVIKEEEAEKQSQGISESLKKKKKKKKKQQQMKQEEETKEGDLPLKNLKTNNKENIEVQQKDKSPKKEQTPNKPKPLTKIKLQSGTTVEDLKPGEGKLAKPGKKVFMYYRGVLASNQKEFDSQLSGKPFMFCLGKGEVIKGWDAGIIGMKVGGKRRLTVPPSQAYGSQRVGPIPPNSTLVFDVELKSVK